MPDLKFNCPHCDQMLEAPDEIPGQTVDCPSCSGSIQLPSPEPTATPPSLPKPQEETPLPQSSSSSVGHMPDGSPPTELGPSAEPPQTAKPQRNRWFNFIPLAVLTLSVLAEVASLRTLSNILGTIGIVSLLLISCVMLFRKHLPRWLLVLVLFPGTAPIFYLVLLFIRPQPPRKPMACPECGNKLSLLRRPTSAQQWWAGGWSCDKCGAELDRNRKVIRAGRSRKQRTTGAGKKRVHEHREPNTKRKAPLQSGIHLSCEGCGKHLKVKTSLQGRTVNCPGCKTPISVPSLKTESRPDDAGPLVLTGKVGSLRISAFLLVTVDEVVYGVARRSKDPLPGFTFLSPALAIYLGAKGLLGRASFGVWEDLENRDLDALRASRYCSVYPIPDVTKCTIRSNTMTLRTRTRGAKRTISLLEISHSTVHCHKVKARLTAHLKKD